MVLPDTSVWIEYLRADRSAAAGTETSSGGPPGQELEGRETPEPSVADELDSVIERQQVLTCGPVVAELLAGARGRQRESLRAQLSTQPWIDLKRSDWLTVGDVAGKLRGRGEVVPLIDLQIAVCAVNGDAELWTCDRDSQRVVAALDGLRMRLFE
jgi:predicted nucleic acid-binding protein